MFIGKYSKWGKPHKISDDKFILVRYYFLMIDTCRNHNLNLTNLYRLLVVIKVVILGELKLKSMKYIFLNKLSLKKQFQIYNAPPVIRILSEFLNFALY